jgi:hypothetical protein
MLSSQLPCSRHWRFRRRRKLTKSSAGVRQGVRTHIVDADYDYISAFEMPPLTLLGNGRVDFLELPQRQAGSQFGVTMLRSLRQWWTAIRRYFATIILDGGSPGSTREVSPTPSSSESRNDDLDVARGIMVALMLELIAVLIFLAIWRMT